MNIEIFNVLANFIAGFKCDLYFSVVDELRWRNLIITVEISSWSVYRTNCQLSVPKSYYHFARGSWWQQYIKQFIQHEDVITWKRFLHYSPFVRGIHSQIGQWCGALIFFSIIASVIEYILGNIMMTSTNGNIFRVTGPLCGEFTGPGEFPAQRPVTQNFDIFFDLPE